MLLPSCLALSLTIDVLDERQYGAVEDVGCPYGVGSYTQAEVCRQFEPRKSNKFR
ncbi:MAG: hypothetical protein OEU26_17075 [Candidatus Tectomicrobia bacterium]|nr:hypothetical protein [Candidatus Tectomicrobia bacterium]